MKYRSSGAVWVGALAIGLLAVTATQGVADDAKCNDCAKVPFNASINMPTFMEHVITPAATGIWHAWGAISDASGVHDLTPRTDQAWENVASAAATLLEATNALMIPQRRLDSEWNRYAANLGKAAQQAYEAAEKHDENAIAELAGRIDELCSDCHKHYHLE